MTHVLLVVSGTDHWTLEDGSQHPTGFWAGEFIHPHQVFTKAGYDITVATPGGVTPTLDEVSLRLDLNNDDQVAVDAQRAYISSLGEAFTKPARLEDIDPTVRVDGNLITGQNPASAEPSAEAVVTYLNARVPSGTAA